MINRPGPVPSSGLVARSRAEAMRAWTAGWSRVAADRSVPDLVGGREPIGIGDGAQKKGEAEDQADDQHTYRALAVGGRIDDVIRVHEILRIESNRCSKPF